MKNKNNINQQFLNLVNSIFNSYTFLASDNNELRNASLEIEMEMHDVYSQAKAYKNGEISLEDFKKSLISTVTKETDQLIVVDEQSNEIPDEQKALLNQLAINAYNKDETEKFATNFYSILSTSRMFVHQKLNNDASVFIVGRNMIQPHLDIFDNNQPASAPTPNSEPNF